MQNAGLDDLQTGIQFAGRNTNNFRYADDTTLMAGSEEKLKSLLMRVKEESETAGLKLNIQKAKIMASDPITSWQVDGEQWKQWQTLFFGLQNHWDEDHSHEIKRHLLIGRKALTNLDSLLKSRNHHFADKVPYSQSYDFPSSHVQMWELDHKGDWAPKNWCFQTVGLEKSLESRLYTAEIKQVHPKGDQPWLFTGSTGTEAEAPVLWPPDAKNQFIGKDPDDGKDWGQEEKGV